MKNIYDSAAQLVGNTPLVRLHNLEQREGLAARLLVKLEGCNPGGSAKDRVAISMLDEAERAGRLHPGVLPHHRNGFHRATSIRFLLAGPFYAGPPGRVLLLHNAPAGPDCAVLLDKLH